MQRRSFLQLLGLGSVAAAAPALAKTVQSPARVVAAPLVEKVMTYPIPIGTILPIMEETHYADTAYISGPCYASLAPSDMPSHSHSFSPSQGITVARTEQRIHYKQWNGTEWRDIGYEDIFKSKGTCG